MIFMTNTFKNITSIRYEGPGSKNAHAFKHYNADEIVAGKAMRYYLRFAVVLPHVPRHGQRSVWCGHDAAPVG